MNYNSHTLLIKTALVQIRIICLYIEVYHTVWNKGDLDSVMKTKPPIIFFIKLFKNALFRSVW